MMSEFEFVRKLCFEKYPFAIIVLILNEFVGAFLVLFSLGAFIPFLGGILDGNQSLPGPIGQVFDYLGVSRWSNVEVLCLLLAFVVFTIIVDAFRNYWAGMIGIRVDREIKLDLNAKVEKSSLSGFQTLKPSKYSQCMLIESLNSSGAIRDLASMISYGIMLSILLVWVVSSSPIVFTVTGVISFIYFKLNAKILSRAHRIARERIDYTAELTSKVTDTKHLFKFMSAEQSLPLLTGKISNLITDVTQSFSRQLRMSTASSGFVRLTGIVLIATVSIIHLVFLDSDGVVLLFDLVLLQRISVYLESFQSKRHAMRQRMPSYDLCMGMIDTEMDAAAKKGTKVASLDKGVKLTNVHFTHNSGRKIANGVSANFPSEGLVYLMGQSGSGKTTLAELILGLRTPDAGSILFDGVDAKELSAESLGKIVSYVPQDAYLPSGTLRSYLTMGTLTDVTDEMIWQALDRVHAVDVVERLSDGLETKLGDGGVIFSGGERHRICIARALLREARLLVLDEPSAALDNKVETIVFETLKELSSEVLIIVITHSQRLAMNSSLLYKLDEGELTQCRAELVNNL